MCCIETSSQTPWVFDVRFATSSHHCPSTYTQSLTSILNLGLPCVYTLPRYMWHSSDRVAVLVCLLRKTIHLLIYQRGIRSSYRFTPCYHALRRIIFVRSFFDPLLRWIVRLAHLLILVGIMWYIFSSSLRSLMTTKFIFCGHSFEDQIQEITATHITCESTSDCVYLPHITI